MLLVWSSLHLFLGKTDIITIAKIAVGREAQAQVRAWHGQNGPCIQWHRAKGTALCDRISRQTNMGNTGMLQTAWSKIRWGLLQKTVRNLRIAGSGSHGWLDHPGVCWRGSTAGYSQCRRVLKCWWQLPDTCPWGADERGTLLDLRPKTKEGHVRWVTAGTFLSAVTVRR